VGGQSIKELNDAIARELSAPSVPKDGLASGREGPLWYRGLAREKEADARAEVDALLARHGVRHIVIGHTTTPGAIIPRFEGKILLIDVGLSRYYGARPACLVVDRGKAWSLHRGKNLRLPVDGGPSLLEYLRAAQALDPPSSPLTPLIANQGRYPLPAASSRE
jgi:hypothetical protein